MTRIKTIINVATLSAAAIVAGCNSIDAPDQNAISITGLTTSPTAASVSATTQNLIAGMRADGSTSTSVYGQFGREAYNLDPGNLQNVQQYFVVLGDVAIWTGPYRTIKLADLVLDAVDRVPSFTDQQKEGYRGFAMTVKAVELLTVIRTLDVSGAALDASDSTNAPLPAIVGRSDVYAYIGQLLDSAQTHLNAGGTTFGFTLGTGFVGFDTPPTFLKFNRAMRVRADIGTGNFQQALTDLGGSFVDLTKPLTYGPYNTYSNAAGDVQNPLYEAQPRVWYTNPALYTGAQKKADGTLDNRFLTKVKATAAITRAGVTTAWTFQNYSGPTAPIYIIRNEELILLRAEANLGLGNAPAAISDINFVRTTAGGLSPISSPYVAAPGLPATLLDELLYEKRYSLMWEEGTSSWLDARNYGKLAQLPHDQPAGSVVYPYTRIPDVECQQRGNGLDGCKMPPTY